METSVKKEAKAVTNQGYGEIMTIRHMDFSPEHPVKGFMIGVITHHYDHTYDDYRVDPFDASVILEASKDLATLFTAFATTES